MNDSEIQQLREELEQVKKERDLAADLYMQVEDALNETHAQLAAKDKVLEPFADRNNWKEDVHTGTVEWIGGGDPWNEAESILSQYKGETI